MTGRSTASSGGGETTAQKAIRVLKEFQSWRRGMGEYAWNAEPSKNKEFPFSPAELGMALDFAIATLEKTKTEQQG